MGTLGTRYLPRASAIAETLLLLAALLAVRPASSQTIKLEPMGISRDVRRGDGGAKSFWLNRADCLADDVLHFSLVLGNNDGFPLTVWKTASPSDDCRDVVARSSASQTCWLLFSRTLPAGQALVDVRVQDLLAPMPRGSGTGTAQNCFGADQVDPSPQQLMIWFMHLLSDAQSVQLGVAVTVPFRYDLVPPGPPLASMGNQDATLTIHWSPVPDADVAGYRVYCDSASSQPSPGVDRADGSDVGSTDPPCISAVLSASGVPPSDANLCGMVESPSATSAALSGLTDGQRYAVAVAAYDTAGNVGALSNVVCGTPRVPPGVVDINGRGGCGCVIAPVRAETRISAWFWLLLGACGVWRRVSHHAARA